MEEKSRYELALGQYVTHLHNDEVEAQAAALLAKHVQENDTTEVRRKLFRCLDLTSLNTTDTEEGILSLVERVNRLADTQADLDMPAALCVYPNMVKLVADSLEVENMQIAAVSAGFPHAQTFIEVKIAETALCLKDGATEIDIVLNVGKFLSGDFEAVCEEIEEQKAVCGKRTLKVILETGALDGASNIKKAAILAMYSGADFLKTSTGKQQPAATPEAVFVLCTTIAEYYKETGRKMGIKVAGGISTIQDALQYYTIVKELLGEEWLTPELFRIGASRLADQLIKELTGEPGL